MRIDKIKLKQLFINELNSCYVKRGEADFIIVYDNEKYYYSKSIFFRDFNKKSRADAINEAVDNLEMQILFYGNKQEEIYD
jgi:hypothetical protein